MPNTLVRSGAYGEAAMRNYGSIEVEVAVEKSDSKAGNVSRRVYASPDGERRMIRKIFVGSSKEGLKYASQIQALLKNEPDIQCVLWPEIFEPGSLTFEALEEMLMECCAAIFVVTPDDQAVIRERTVRLPRANVMLEFGLVAGRLGRHNIALCSYGTAELPSDLAGLTIIKMDGVENPHNEAESILLHSGEAQLRRWCSRSLPTTERVPRTEVVHGYTGTWDFELALHLWRGLPVCNPSYAQVHGQLTLWISADGECGAGNAHGHLAFKLFKDSQPPCSQNTKPRLESKPFAGELQVAHELQSVECLKNGGLKLQSRIHSIQQLFMNGRPPAELEGLQGPPEPCLFEWLLTCTSAPRVLEGTFKTEVSPMTEGVVKAIRKHS